MISIERRRLVFVVAFAAIFGCSDDDGNPGQDGDGSGASESGGSGSGSATAGMSSTTPASSGPSASDDGADSTASSSADGASFINMEGGSDGPTGPQPNGAQCGTNEECESMFCYTIPMFGGVCSECLVDADCGTGTCAFSPAAMYGVCTDGSLGVMCDSDEGCMGDLVCTELIDTGGLLNASFCSECGPSAPCAGDGVCSPTYDLGNFAGYMSCAAPGSVPNDGGCPLDDMGNPDGTPCVSQICTAADIFMGFVSVGVCGECATDVDCMAPQTCMPAAASMAGLSGSVCG